MKYLAMTSVVAIVSACATIEPVCDPKMARAVTNSSGDILYWTNPSCPSVADGSSRTAATKPTPITPTPSEPTPNTPDNPEPTPSEPTPNTPDNPEPTPSEPSNPEPSNPKGDASLNSGEDRTGRGDNEKGQGKNRP